MGGVGVGGQRDGEERHCRKTHGPWKHRTRSQAPADSEEGWASWPLPWALVSPLPTNEREPQRYPLTCIPCRRHDLEATIVQGKTGSDSENAQTRVFSQVLKYPPPISDRQGLLATKAQNGGTQTCRLRCTGNGKDRCYRVDRLLSQCFYRSYRSII